MAIKIFRSFKTLKYATLGGRDTRTKSCMLGQWDAAESMTYMQCMQYARRNSPINHTRLTQQKGII